MQNYIRMRLLRDNISKLDCFSFFIAYTRMIIQLQSPLSINSANYTRLSTTSTVSSAYEGICGIKIITQKTSLKWVNTNGKNSTLFKIESKKLPSCEAVSTDWCEVCRIECDHISAAYSTEFSNSSDSRCSSCDIANHWETSSSQFPTQSINTLMAMIWVFLILAS